MAHAGDVTVFATNAWDLLRQWEQPLDTRVAIEQQQRAIHDASLSQSTIAEGSIQLAVNAGLVPSLGRWFADNLPIIVPVRLSMEAMIAKYGGPRVLDQTIPMDVDTCEGSPLVITPVTIELARLSHESLGISEETAIAFECVLGELEPCDLRMVRKMPVVLRREYAEQIALSAGAGDMVWTSQVLLEKYQDKHSTWLRRGAGISIGGTTC